MQTDNVHASDYLLFLYWAVIVRGRYKHWCHYCCQMNSLIVWSKPPQKSPLACPRKRFTPGSTSILPSVSRIPRETSQNTYRKPIQYLQKPQWIPTETSQNIPGETLQNTYRNLTEYLEKAYRIPTERPLMFLKSKTDEDWSLFVLSTCMIMCSAVFIYKFL